jgi:hypothetical protein
MKQFIILPEIKNWIKTYITGFRYFFHKDFIEENYIKHFLYSVLIGILLLSPLCLLESFRETQLIFKIIFSGTLLYAINWIREDNKRRKYKAPFSQLDINFGSYGGIISAILIQTILWLVEIK